MEPFQILLIVLGIAAVLWLVIWQAKAYAERERRRRLGLAALAGQNGMEFSQSDRWDLDSQYNGVAEIGRGHDRYALDVLRRSDPRLTAFRYHFKTWETRTVRRGKRTVTQRYEKTHWRQYLIAEIGSQFPQLTLRGEGFLDKLAGMVGFDDIDFESEQFSKRYFCKSSNREFAYAVIHPRMMEYLMDLGFQVELSRGLLVMDLSHYSFDAPGVLEAMRRLAGFVNRIPDFVWQDYGQRDTVKLPEPTYTPPAELQKA